MFGHSGTVNTCGFSAKGDFFGTGGVDGDLLIWKSSFADSYGESIVQKGLCESGHRTDARTQAPIEECMKKRTKICSNTHFP